MAIKTVTFDDKQNLNTNSDIARINKVIDDDINQLKDVANTNANNIGNLEELSTTDKSSLVNAINNLTYNLVTNGGAVKTGRLIDGKEEYVKRYQMPINSVSGEINTRAQGSAPLGLNLSAITVTEMNGCILSNTNNVFSLDTSNFNAGNNYVYISYESNEVRVLCDSENYNNTAIINVYFIYNE